MLLGAACAPHRQAATLAVLPKVTLHAVALYPFGFRWTEPSYRSFELSHRIYRGLEAELGDKAVLFAPPDFRVYRPKDDNAWAASNLVSVLQAHGLKPDHTLVIRPWAERRARTSSNRVENKKGQGVSGGEVDEVVYVGHVELLYPSTRTVLLEVTGEVKVDPFARGLDDTDPNPALTRLMEALGVEAIRAVASIAKPPMPPVRATLSYRFSPLAVVLKYSDGGRPTLEKILGPLDPLEADVVRMARLRFANPSISDSDASKLFRLSGGVWLTRPLVDLKLSAGDLIVSVDGQPATPQALQRLRFRKQPSVLKVRKASGKVEDVPWKPAVPVSIKAGPSKKG
jgi:hypothetical protein